MEKWESARTRTTDIDLHYLRTGGERPPLILLHGLITSGACWSDIAIKLASDFDVIMPDSRGHGSSGAPESPIYRYEDLADDVIYLIENLRLSQPILVGHSMGGMTAALVAANKPGLIGKLILVDPTFLSLKQQEEVFQSDLVAQHREMLELSFDELQSKAIARSPNRSKEMIGRLVHARLQMKEEAFDILRPPNPAFEDLVQDIRSESLLVTGDRGIVSEEQAQKLQSLNSRFQYQVIQGASHAFFYDCPELLVNSIRKFLKIRRVNQKPETWANFSENRNSLGPKPSVLPPALNIGGGSNEPASTSSPSISMISGSMPCMISPTVAARA